MPLAAAPFVAPRPPARLPVYAALAGLVLLGWVYVVLGHAETGLAMRSLSLAPVLVLFLMWAAMAVAMMLPTALPMLAAVERIRTVRDPSLLWLVAGYLGIWVACAVAATLGQVLLARAGTLSVHMGPAGPAFAASVLFAAGIYQFTPAKWLCLVRCRNPLGGFAGALPQTGYGMWKLGLEEGLGCLGACWALMAVMFAAGLMNPLWMAALAVVMGVEKVASGYWLTVVIGLGLVITGGFVAAPLFGLHALAL